MIHFLALKIRVMMCDNRRHARMEKSKRRNVCEETRDFNTSWVDSFTFTADETVLPVCLICGDCLLLFVIDLFISVYFLLILSLFFCGKKAQMAL